MGRVKLQASLRDAAAIYFLPGTEVPGYVRLSLWDSGGYLSGERQSLQGVVRMSRARRPEVDGYHFPLLGYFGGGVSVGEGAGAVAEGGKTWSTMGWMESDQMM